MLFEDDEDLSRLRSLIHRPVTSCPDWLMAWREEATHLLFLARQAAEYDLEIQLLFELTNRAREMSDMAEDRLKEEGL